MVRVALVAAGLAAAMALPAYAQGPDAATVAAAPEATVAASDDELADPDKIICRKATPPTGTRIRGRSAQQICMTKADWEQLWADAEAAARDQDNPYKNDEFLNGSPE